MSSEEIQIILSFRESNPTMGVKKIVDSLRGQIPSINAKMVRSVQLPDPITPETVPNVDDKASQEPSQSRAQRRAKPTATDYSIYATHTTGPSNAIYTCPKSPALLNMFQMYVKAQAAGREYKGWYPLKAHGNTEYDYQEMLWVNVKQGDETQAIMFERMKIEATLGHKEALWMLWTMLKTARNDTEGGEAAVTDLAIIQQLTAEYGSNPMEVESDLQLESGTMNPASMRLASLMASMAR